MEAHKPCTVSLARTVRVTRTVAYGELDDVLLWSITRSVTDGEKRSCFVKKHLGRLFSHVAIFWVAAAFRSQLTS